MSPPAILTKVNFLIRPNSMRTNWGRGRGLKDLNQDFEMGVATRIRSTFRILGRATHNPPVCDGWQRPSLMGLPVGCVTQLRTP